MESKKICKRCLLREMELADVQNITKYIDAIRPEDRVKNEVYEGRLAICKECDFLNAGTCNACGCYVEIRALGKKGRCPYHKWNKGSSHSVI